MSDTSSEPDEETKRLMLDLFLAFDDAETYAETYESWWHDVEARAYKWLEQHSIDYNHPPWETAMQRYEREERERQKQREQADRKDRIERLRAELRQLEREE